HRIVPALKVGSENISVAEYNFDYYNNVTNYVSTMENYGMKAESIGLDLNKPLSEQKYSIGAPGISTWDDYFKTQTTTSIKSTVQLYLAAKDDGVKLPEAKQKELDESFKNLEEYCKNSNISVDKYLAQNYGKGVTENIARKSIERSYLAEYYSGTKKDTFSFSDAQITDYYNKHKSDFDFADYRSFDFSGEPPAASKTPSALNSAAGSTAAADDKSSKDAKSAEATAADNAAKDAAMAQAKQKADKMAALVTDEASFIKLAAENAPKDQKESYKDPEYTLKKGATASGMMDSVKAWVYDDARKSGDKAAVKTNSGYTVLYFIKRYRPNDPTVSVRHILIQPQITEGAKSATPEQKATAKKTAEDIYKQWQSGKKTEDSFAELAQKSSSDPSSADKGGLYKNIHPGQMVPTFNDWCFDASRKPGDSGIVESSYGYHIMYFVGKSKAYWMANVEDTLISNAYKDFADSLDKKYKSAEKSFGMSLAGKK
ncbi:MAG: peptidylprolyl isomerase, partial [Bacillota bacterium]|nr:peptidylprolyl isomerase [Bacillota bacterium]